MSGEKIPYHLRQNKHVERQLFVELLAHVDRVHPIKDYLYVSFGGVFFEDFKLVHSHFGATHLLSLEEIEWIYQRQQKNRPHGCINCRHMTSSTFIENLPAIRNEFPNAKHLLCWLDYAAANDTRKQLEEFRSLLPRLERFDVVKITINANVATLGDFRETIKRLRQDPNNEDTEAQLLQTSRLQKLREKLGDMLAEGIDAQEMTKAAYPGVLLRSIQLVAAQGIRENPSFIFQPLASYLYADSEHSMLTCTGIVMRHRDRSRFLLATKLRKFEFAGLNWQLIRIDIPFLSPREKFILDTDMYHKTPEETAATLGFKFDSSEEKSLSMLSEYFKFHRFYPHFHRIQY